MIRTRIRLTEQLCERLTELAHNKNKSVAAMVPEALDQSLEIRTSKNEVLYRQALKVVGEYRCGASDISTDHDGYLEEEFGN